MKIINQLNPFNLWLKAPAAMHFSFFTFHFSLFTYFTSPQATMAMGYFTSKLKLQSVVGIMEAWGKLLFFDGEKADLVAHVNEVGGDVA